MDFIEIRSDFARVMVLVCDGRFIVDMILKVACRDTYLVVEGRKYTLQTPLEEKRENGN